MIIDNLENKLILKLDNKLLTKNDLSDFICNSIINDQELTYYLYYNIFTNDNIISNYSFLTKIITSNYNKMLKIAKDEYQKNNLTNEIYFYNLYILLIILHEINHAKQNYIINETNYPIKDLFLKELNYTAINHNYYQKYHNLFALERSANIISLENILYLLEEKTFNSELYIYFNNQYFYTLFNSYLKGISPNNITSLYLLKTYPFKNNTLTIDDKLKYGLELNNNEILTLIKKYKKKKEN